MKRTLYRRELAENIVAELVKPFANPDELSYAISFTEAALKEYESQLLEKAAEIAEQVADDAVQSRTIEIAEHAWIAREIATKIRKEIKK